MVATQRVRFVLKENIRGEIRGRPKAGDSIKVLFDVGFIVDVRASFLRKITNVDLYESSRKAPAAFWNRLQKTGMHERLQLLEELDGRFHIMLTVDSPWGVFMILDDLEELFGILGQTPKPEPILINLLQEALTAIDNHEPDPNADCTSQTPCPYCAAKKVSQILASLLSMLVDYKYAQEGRPQPSLYMLLPQMKSSLEAILAAFGDEGEEPDVFSYLRLAIAREITPAVGFAENRLLSALRLNVCMPPGTIPIKSQIKE
jgi:hypothetical protein